MAVDAEALRKKRLAEKLAEDIESLNDLGRAKIRGAASAAKNVVVDPAARKEAAQRMVAAGRNVFGGAATGAQYAGTAAKAAAGAAAAETRKIGMAAKNVAYAPVAAGKAVGAAIENHNVALFFLIAFLVHAFDAASGFPRQQFGLELAGRFQPTSMIALGALFIAYTIFKQTFKQGTAIIAIGIFLYLIGVLFPFIDLMLQIYVWVIIAVWLFAFNGLEGGRENELIMLIFVGILAYAYPFLGFYRPELLIGFGKYFLNPLVHPWLFYYGIIKFQAESKFAKRAGTLIVMVWVIVALSLYSTNNELVVGGETITKQHYLTAAETLGIIKDASIKATINFVTTLQGASNKWIKAKVAEAAGLEEYPGEKKGEKEGLVLNLAPDTDRKIDLSSGTREIKAYATLEPVKRLQKPVKVKNIECELKRAEGKETVKGSVRPDIKETVGKELVANEQLPVSCSIPKEGLNVGTSRIKISATYTFETSAELRTHFMDAKRLHDELIKLGSFEAVARAHGIKETRPATKYGDSPVKIGIGGLPQQAPIGISDKEEETKVGFIGVSITNNKEWRGKIARINSITLEVPSGFWLSTKPDCAFEQITPNKFRVKKELYEGMRDIEDFESFRCDAGLVTDINQFLNNQPTAEKAFVVYAEYEYKTETEYPVEVTQSKEASSSSGSGTGSSGPEVSCSEMPSNASISKYESKKALFDNKESLKSVTERVAAQYGIDRALLVALEEEESMFNDASKCDEQASKSSLTGCGWPGKKCPESGSCSCDCSCNNENVWSDELQLQCSAGTFMKGYTGEIKPYDQCQKYSGDDRWSCVFCVYLAGSEGVTTDCSWNTKIRGFYCRWKNYYEGLQGELV